MKLKVLLIALFPIVMIGLIVSLLLFSAPTIMNNDNKDDEQGEISVDVPTEFDDVVVQAIMNEALKYEGWAYVFGGASPSTSFDCSGITQWSYAKAGITLPRTAQLQYNVTKHIPLSEAKAGDLIFFHSTYVTADYVTHVGIYVGDMQMYHAGDPIGYTDLNAPYWQQHLIGAGRIVL